MRLYPRLGLARRTVRLRLTLLYGALFLVCGTVLVGITYILASQSTSSVYTYRGPDGTISVLTDPTTKASPGGSLRDSSGDGSHDRSTTSPPETARVAAAAAREQRDRQLNDLVAESAVALGITTVISLGVGWLVAGHVLRRLHRVTTAARSISANNLHERLALDGPDDELKELGDTFDQLLARLESSFLSQRQFIANVSHELRTPMARQRTLAQVALADPDATVDSLRTAHERVLAAGSQQEQLVLALLTLARGQAGLSRREPFDLARLTEEVVLSRSGDAAQAGVTVRTELDAAPASGDARLVERMVVNLVDNALRHNVPDGLVKVSTRNQDGRTVLTVANTGPVIPGAAVEQLFQPFERLGAGRGEGLGLGLSIVRAIADAHDAEVDARPRAGGGLVTTVTFPAPDPADHRGAAASHTPVRV